MDRELCGRHRTRLKDSKVTKKKKKKLETSSVNIPYFKNKTNKKTSCLIATNAMEEIPRLWIEKKGALVKEAGTPQKAKTTWLVRVAPGSGIFG